VPVSEYLLVDVDDAERRVAPGFQPAGDGDRPVGAIDVGAREIQAMTGALRC
jgi:hypothetical protein